MIVRYRTEKWEHSIVFLPHTDTNLLKHVNSENIITGCNVICQKKKKKVFLVFLGVQQNQGLIDFLMRSKSI